MGATVRENGVNFCLYAKDATAVELLLFDSPESAWPDKTLWLDPEKNKTFQYWHIFIEGLAANQIYAYRVDGPYAPKQGLRFNRNKVLIDPYARLVVGWPAYSRQAASTPFDNCPQALRGVVIDPQQYDWENDLHPQTSYADTVIYELHVGGFTQHPNSELPIETRGTYAGLIEKIPYLQSLGVTAVELMPIQQFDDSDAPGDRENYWGYSSVAFFAPHWGYSANKTGLGPVDEFRDMVKALHKAGIEVILDVVFNHTAEGNHEGPTLSFRGLSNESYYILEDDKAHYKNYSGCGNTLKTSTISSYLILDCLRYWVLEMHVDGFRFDLASVLSRGITGEPLEIPPILWLINTDPALAGIKIIAEAWDAAGLYQVGRFAGERFAEWNGPYRDEVRRFVRSDRGLCGAIAHRIMGSPDLYPHLNRGPNYSINFVTCHDGFTLHDLVSYNHKHNEANGEDSRDGANDNWSWNCGVEGPTDDPSVQALRRQQAKNMFVLWAMSQGTPMMLMGDEVLRSQHGNNNAYCQNNTLSWFDWDDVSTQQDFLRFVQQLVNLIQTLHLFKHDEQLIVTDFDPQEDRLEPLISWHGITLGQPDWSEDSRSLSFTLRYRQYGELLHVIFNAYWEPLTFELPPLTPPAHSKPAHWQRIIDTALAAPQDFCPIEQAPKVEQSFYSVAARSAVVLITNSW
ncbi:glycogen debranching protein GlgX [cf. Phormidesmis sp. LEGE 11477]|uniref:glycogen debranching protein GlgX n=1 Tax=cf. Phormidesmis sp. LEGE 11477 TaxID=1828680 RepID=UPI001D1383CB|nr:glycogen debranching protein GlgX [cf. Phormidesmis sp. LEGE 11477]